MLFTPDGKQITQVPDTADMRVVLRLLGDRRAEGVRREVNRIIDELPPDKKTGRRTFSSPQAGTQLEPWPYPLASLYDIALEIEGKDSTGRQVHDQALRIFGLFVRECIMERQEKWVIDDQNVNPSDPDRAMTDAVYVEQGPEETSTKHP